MVVPEETNKIGHEIRSTDGLSIVGIKIGGIWEWGKGKSNNTNKT